MWFALVYSSQDRCKNTSNPGEAVLSDALMQVIHAAASPFPHHSIYLRETVGHVCS